MQKERVINFLTDWRVITAAGLIAAFMMIAATYVARSNADYICTHVVDNESACNVDSWSDWSDVSGTATTTACVSYDVTQHRVGTGTKTLSTTITYLNTRTQCESGYTQTQVGNNNGASGNQDRGGEVFTTSAACQIDETRTVRRTVAGAQCVGTPIEIVTNIGTSTETTGAVITGGGENPTYLGSMDQINDFRRSMIAVQIAAVPPLVNPNMTTKVRWTSRETTRCNVSGSNGDSWTATTTNPRTAGEETTRPITGRTTYTLNCIAFDGSATSTSATVDQNPNWQEQ